MRADRHRRRIWAIHHAPAAPRNPASPPANRAIAVSLALPGDVPYHMRGFGPQSRWMWSLIFASLETVPVFLVVVGVCAPRIKRRWSQGVNALRSLEARA